VFTILPWSHGQVPVWTICESISSGYIRWDSISAGADLQWAAYASVVDNSSGDAVFLEERVDTGYTAQQPYYNITGWWTGTFVRPADSIVYDVYFEQESAKIEGWMYNSDGFLEVTVSGVESQGQMSIDRGSFYYLPCLEEVVNFGSASVTGSLVSGSMRVAGPCMNGTIRFDLVKSTR